MVFYVVIFSKSMLCKYFYVRSNLGLIGFEYFFWEKALHVKGNKIPKANLICTWRFTRLLNLDTVRAMSRTNGELQIWNGFERMTLNFATEKKLQVVRAIMSVS